MRLRWLLAPLLTTAIMGCGDATPPPKAKPAPAPPIAASVPPAAAPSAAKPTEKKEPKAKRVRRAVDKAKVAQMFQIPELAAGLASPINPGDPSLAGLSQAPSIRLLGFSRVGGVQRALVEIRGEVLSIEQGDIVDGAEVVAVDAEGVSFQFAGQRWASKLFEKRPIAPPTVTPASIARAHPIDQPAPPAAAIDSPPTSHQE